MKNIISPFNFLVVRLGNWKWTSLLVGLSTSSPEFYFNNWTLKESQIEFVHTSQFLPVRRNETSFHNFDFGVALEILQARKCQFKRRLSFEVVSDNFSEFVSDWPLANIFQYLASYRFKVFSYLMRGNNIIIMNITYNIKLEGKKLGSVTSRNQILLLPCQLEMGQKNISSNTQSIW